MPKKILIVDDEPDIRKTLAMLLESAGYVVIEAEDGPKALELVAKENPDLVFLDLVMPEMDGVQVLEAVKRGRPALPVIMLTGEQDLAKALQTLEYGALMYVTKPYDAGYLREQADRLLGAAAGSAPDDKPWRIQQ